MLICAILNWGRDLLIKPIDSIEQAKDWKNRLGNGNTDFIIFSSQYLTPIKLDNINTQPDDEALTELYKHSWKRPPIFEE